MRARTQHLQSLGHRHEGLTPQCAAHQINHRCGQVREIAEGFVLDAIPVAVTAPKQMRLVHTAFVGAPCGDDMYGASTFRHGKKRSTLAPFSQLFSDYNMYPCNASHIARNTEKLGIC